VIEHGLLVFTEFRLRGHNERSVAQFVGENKLFNECWRKRFWTQRQLSV
jgi:hypothetical protein